MYFSEKIHSMHHRNTGATLPRWFQRSSETFRARARSPEFPIHQRNGIADELGENRDSPQPALLRVEKHAHQPARLVAEHAGDTAEFRHDEFESVHGSAKRAARLCNSPRSEICPALVAAATPLRCSSVPRERNTLRECV